MHSPGASPSFSSSLVTHQTTSQPPAIVELMRAAGDRFKARQDARQAAKRARRATISAAEDHFRHSFWRKPRAAVQRVLGSGHFSQGRAERFANCGSRCSVELCRETGEFRLRAHYCGDRACRPCQAARALKIKRAIAERFNGHTARFVTLTLKRDDQSLKVRMTRLLKCFAKLRRSSVWADAVTGGVRFVEVTRGADGQHWHVHIHALVTGSFIDQRELSREWLRITGDSHRVDIRKVPDLTAGVGYVAKYGSKGFGGDVYGRDDHLAECLLALAGRRLVSAFGIIRQGRIDQLDDDGKQWEYFHEFNHLAASAACGEAWAVGLMKHFKRTPPQERDASAALSAAFSIDADGVDPP